MFRSWEQEITTGLQSFHFDPERAKLLATAALSQLEGALLLARTHQSMEPLQRAEEPIRVLVRAFAKAWLASVNASRREDVMPRRVAAFPA